MIASAYFTTLLLFLLSHDVSGAPTASTPVIGRSIPLRRLSPSSQNLTLVAQRAKGQRDMLVAKYSQSLAKRATGYNLYVNSFMSSILHPEHSHCLASSIRASIQGAQRAPSSRMLLLIGRLISYYGSIAVGTPPTAFDVILDTGSALVSIRGFIIQELRTIICSDLWLTSPTCGVVCGNSPTYNPATSSSFQNLSMPFEITYGSGAAAGYLAQETVQMAGFSVQKQAFGTFYIHRALYIHLMEIGVGVVNALSSNFNQNPVSGLMGLAWASLASSGKTPFWQTLAGGGSWDSALFGVQLTRYEHQKLSLCFSDT